MGNSVVYLIMYICAYRYLHYLTYYNIGLAKEDYSLLARSNLAPKMEIVQTADSRNKRKSYKEEDDLYSDGGC